MTADRIFTPPAHNESAARAEQARELLALAVSPDHLVAWGGDGSRNYEHGFEALRDTLAGQGQATLAVHAELARIAAALEMIAKTPAAVDQLADRVTESIRDLTSTVDQGVEFADTTAAATSALVVGVHGLTDAVDCLAKPRPRWWQWQLRVALRKLRQQQAFVPDAATPAQEKNPKVYEFLVEVRRQEPHTTTSYEVLGRARFHAEYFAACDTAGTMLPGLCAQLGTPADPDQVYGQVSCCTPDGSEDWYVGAAFLPGATVIQAPPGGF